MFQEMLAAGSGGGSGGATGTITFTTEGQTITVSDMGFTPSYLAVWLVDATTSKGQECADLYDKDASANTYIHIAKYNGSVSVNHSKAIPNSDTNYLNSVQSGGFTMKQGDFLGTYRYVAYP